MTSTTSAGAANSKTNTVGRDLLASVVVFLVALPLCMGIAIASGAPVAAGLITGIIGGILVGSIAGSPLQVSGPAAGMTVVVYEIVREQGYEALGLVVMLAGVIQLTAGVLRLGLWFRAVPPVVVEGMLGGIGILIVASQFHVLVDDSPKGSGWKNIVAIPAAIQKGLPVPELESRDERLLHSAMLSDFVRLHTQQKQIQARVLATLPREASGDVPEIVQMRLKELVPLETTLQEKLATWQTLLHGNEGGVLDAAKRQRVEQALQNAQAVLAANIVALGASKVSELVVLQNDAEGIFGTLANTQKNHAWAGKLGLLTIVIILLWNRIPSKRFKLVPGPLVAITVVTALAYYLALPVVRVDVPGNLFNELHLPTSQTLEHVQWLRILISGGVVALIASAETLLCCSAVDQMHSGPRTKYDQELIAQGCGNFLCGVVNALPMTGVIVRSATNVQAGGATRVSAILHGVWLLLFVVFFTTLLRAIPTAALAAMLIYTGLRLIKIPALFEFWHLSHAKIAIYIVTALTIVLEDLLTGVIVGIVLSALRLLFKFSWFECRFTTATDAKQVRLDLHGAATFLRLPLLAAALEKVPSGAELHVQLDHLSFIDHACLEALTNWEKSHIATGGQLVIDWDTLTARFNPVPTEKPSTPSIANGSHGVV